MNKLRKKRLEVLTKKYLKACDDAYDIVNYNLYKYLIAEGVNEVLASNAQTELSTRLAEKFSMNIGFADRLASLELEITETLNDMFTEALEQVSANLEAF